MPNTQHTTLNIGPAEPPIAVPHAAGQRDAAEPRVLAILRMTQVVHEVLKTTLPPPFT